MSFRFEKQKNGMKNFCKHYSVFKERVTSRFTLISEELGVKDKKIFYRLLRSMSRLFDKNLRIFFIEALSE